MFTRSQWTAVFLLAALLVLATPALAQETLITPDNAAALKLVAQIPEGPVDQYGFAWSPDGNSLAVVEETNIQIYSVTPTALQLHHVIETPRDDLSRAAWTPDSRLLVIGDSWQGRVTVWDVGTGEYLKLLTSAVPVATDELIVSPDGRLIAAFNISARTVEVWGVPGDNGYAVITAGSAGNLQRVASFEHAGNVRSIVFSGDGKLLASATATGVLHIWDMTTMTQTAAYPFAETSPVAVGFLPGGAQLVVALVPGSELVRLDRASGEITPITDGSAPDRVNAIALNGMGTLLAAAHDELSDNPVRMWDVQTGELKAELVGLSWIGSEIAFNPQGTMIAAFSNTDGVLVWGLDNPLEFDPIAPMLQVGGSAEITLATPTDALNIRSEPNTASVRVAQVRGGALVTILDGPVHADGLTWWKIRLDDTGYEGWAVERVDGTRTLMPKDE